MKPDQRERLIGNIVASMKNVPDHIQERQLWHFKRADPAYGGGVAQGLGWEIKDIIFTQHEEVNAVKGMAGPGGEGETTKRRGAFAPFFPTWNRSRAENTVWGESVNSS